MYKFLKLKNKQIISGYNEDFRWQIGNWYEAKGNLEMCQTGFHCSEKIYDAFQYVQGEILAEVVTDGKNLKQDDKQCWQKIKIVKAYSWTKKDSLKLAIFSAESVIDIYEKDYPDDDRPRKAIEAAKKVLQKDTKANRAAAWAARAAAKDKIEKWLLNHIKELKEYK